MSPPSGNSVPPNQIPPLEVIAELQAGLPVLCGSSPQLPLLHVTVYIRQCCSPSLHHPPFPLLSGQQ